MAKKQKNPTITSPKGVLSYPYLNSPDTKYSKHKGGEYKVKLILDPKAPGVAEFLKRLDEEAEKSFQKYTEEHKKKAKDMRKVLPYKDETDDDGNETGKVITSGITMRALVEPSENSSKKFDPFTQAPKVYDAQGKPMVKPPKIGGGTVAKISMELPDYYAAADNKAGVSLRLQAVQILELRSFGERSAESFGFGKEEGFTQDEPTENDHGFADEGTATTPAGGSEEEDF